MTFFDGLKDSLKHKWVQFFQSNRFWIDLHSDTVATPDGGKRPASYLILGVISALEPQLAQLMLPFSRLNPDVDALINVLGLDFDPNLLIGDRSSAEKQVHTQKGSQEPLSQLSNGLLDEKVIISYRDESGVVGDEESKAFAITSLSELIVDKAIPTADTEDDDRPDDFGNAFFDIASEPNLDFEQTFDSETALEEESQSNSDRNTSHLFPFN